MKETVVGHVQGCVFKVKRRRAAQPIGCVAAPQAETIPGGKLLRSQSSKQRWRDDMTLVDGHDVMTARGLKTKPAIISGMELRVVAILPDGRTGNDVVHRRIRNVAQAL